MEQEVTDEVQAAMSLKLVENVQKLIRDEVNKAFNDTAFISSLNMGLFAHVMVQGMRYNPDFKKAVKDVIVDQMQRY